MFLAYKFELSQGTDELLNVYLKITLLISCIFSSYFGLQKGYSLFQNVLALVHLQDLILSFKICSIHKLGICDIRDNELLCLEASGIKKALLHKNIFIFTESGFVPRKHSWQKKVFKENRFFVFFSFIFFFSFFFLHPNEKGSTDAGNLLFK